MLKNILYINGNIYTMNPASPCAQALAIDPKSGLIVAVGTDDEIRRLPHEDIIDLKGRTVLPGFIDAHIHLLATAYRAARVDAGQCTSETAVAELVRIQAEGTPPGQWIEGGYWDRNLWSGASLPTRASLDAVTDRHPVALWSKDGHLLWANSLALTLAEIDATTPSPPTGTIIRDGASNPTGILQEGDAIKLVADRIEPPGREQSRILLQQLCADLLRKGITTVHTIEDGYGLSLLRELRAEGTLSVRGRVILPRQMLPEVPRMGLAEDGDDWLRVIGIKSFADGTLGSQTAAMFEPFEGSSENYGILTISASDLQEAIYQATRLNLLSAIHVIGDRAAHVALDAIEGAWARYRTEPAESNQCSPLPRARLEHVQLITPADMARMRQSGIVASVQPFHAVADRDIAPRYWGERHRRAYAYRTLWEMGIQLALGSDAPVETYDPLRILYAATVRSDPSTELLPWLPEHALHRENALWAYTMGGAYAGGEEARLGSLVAGKLGDAIVLDKDPLRQAPEALANNTVVATISGGRVVYDNCNLI